MKSLFVVILFLTSCITTPKPVDMPVVESMLYGWSDRDYAVCIRSTIRLYVAAQVPADFAFVERHCEDVRRSFLAHPPAPNNT